MEFGSKLEEMKLTSDEIGRLTKAMQDDTFRKLLHEYAEEISNPENRRKYEEEIKLLEQERGMDVQFVHPTPFQAIKTSDGKQKCFINICSNKLIKTPECVPCTGENGRRGLNWQLPYSLAPGRPDVDSNGMKCTIYDVVFHPDALHLASKNLKFMDLVESTAFDGIQDSFKVKLDRKNKKVLKTKYKGASHATVIRKQTPGPTEPKPRDENDPLAFPYPYDSNKSSAPTSDKKPPPANKATQTTPTEALKPCDAGDQPTQPKYTVKYRSVVDMLDYRNSRDSAPGPRPREIVIAVDLPLLRCVSDADLTVSDKQLVLKSKKPDYLLELDLAYPVDESKGHAKFNKLKKQLVVTLPVLPDRDLPPFTQSSVHATDGDAEVEDQPNKLNTAEQEPKEISTAEDGSQLACQSTSDAEVDAELSGSHVQCTNLALDLGSGTVPGIRSNEDQVSDVQECTELTSVLTLTEPVTVNNTKEEANEARTTHEKVDTFPDLPVTSPAEKTLETTLGRVTFKEKAHHAESTDEAVKAIAEEGSQPDSCAASSEQSPDVVAESQTLNHHHKEVNGDSTSQGKAPNICQDTLEKSSTSSSSSSGCNNNTETLTHSSIKKTVRFSERVSVAGGEEEEIDEDDFPLEQQQQQQSVGKVRPRQPPVVLRELNPEDGTEVIISDHTTTSAFQFQNSLLYDLD